MKGTARGQFSLGENADNVLAGSHLPQVMARNESKVRLGFWAKIARVARWVPFSEDVVAAYFCAFDSKTPFRVRGTLLAALAYFILPTDLIPDIILGLGFTDDAAVIATAIALVRNHITPEHRDAAKAALNGDVAASDPDQADVA
jgi:uncharacterized membrane protein YkvA (DUF1232 family)